MIYFIREGGLDGMIKIGMAADPIRRLASLQTAHHKRLELLAVADGSREREHEEHQRWGLLRVKGEWFRPDEELVKYVANLNWVSGDCGDCGEETMYHLVTDNEVFSHEPLCEKCEEAEARRVELHTAKRPKTRFLVWLKQFKEEDSPMGDLARDMADDRNKPRSFNTLGSLEKYLTNLGACDEALQTAEEAWHEYVGITEYDTARLPLASP